MILPHPPPPLALGTRCRALPVHCSVLHWGPGSCCSCLGGSTELHSIPCAPWCLAPGQVCAVNLCCEFSVQADAERKREAGREVRCCEKMYRLLVLHRHHFNPRIHQCTRLLLWR